MRSGVDSGVMDMRAVDPSPQQRGTLVAVRWALIAICAALIVFSDHMSGRLGFAALLLLAVVVGRYGRARFARTLRPPAQLDGVAQPPVRRVPDADLRRREVGR